MNIRTSAIIVFIFLFYLTAYAQSKISAGYEYYFSQDNDFSSSYLRYDFNALGHNVFIGYDRFDGRNDEYDPLQRVGLIYSYLGDKHLFGAVVMSASDKPFNTIETTSMIGFYGYSIYSRVLGKESIPLPNGETFEYERKTSFYVGVGIANEPIVYGGYFLPVISYMYQGEHLYFSLGLPITAITFIPGKKHRFTYVVGFQGNGEFKYVFRPTPADEFTLSYIGEEDAYRLSDVVVKSGDKDSRLIYKTEWLKFDYKHMFNNDLGVSVMYAMMTDGYYFNGKYYHTAPSRRLPPAMKYGISMEFKF